MDKLERRMKADAAAIEAEVTPQLQARIEASLHGARPLGPMPAEEKHSTTLWWASSLTGLVTAAVVIVLLNWQQDRSRTEPVEVASDYPTEPAPVLPIHGRVPLRARTADLTAPLEQELLDLQSDIEKARENLERDLRSSF